MIVAIKGAGRMARGIGTRALAGGHEVHLLDDDPERAERLAAELAPHAAIAQVQAVADLGDADLVVVATPYPAGRDYVAGLGDLVNGAVVVDISNPVDFTTMDGLRTPPGTSAAEEMAAASPGARVVKAFNTTFAKTLETGEVAGRPLDVFLAGDDTRAKEMVADLVESGGMRPIDAGPLRRARELEAFMFLNLTLQDRLGLNQESAIKILS
ncbi:NADP oxidoreductase [Bailinhaonella thermotolerans]|uniref:NADP oxidoreductase n=1 Tax=Bailinhaonella thermotolerans TaxID=1070861 RepID=A0A3A4B2T1_9ACTN|nr:NADP oxidoreductase [Bailinhaonella thermotolerans]